MPDLAQFPHVLANGPGNAPDADQVMANFQHIRTAHNASIASALADSGSAGQLVVVNNTGAPAYRAMSGDATISDTGVLTIGNNVIDGDNLTDGLAQQLGLSETGVVRRGKSIIATEEARTNPAYGTLTTPDQVQNVVLPTDGLIVVAAHALFKSSVAGAGRAAIFVGANQLKIGTDEATAPEVQEAPTSGTSYNQLATGGFGLTLAAPSGTASTVTTGQVIGAIGGEFGIIGAADIYRPASGPTYIFAAAGTYTISLQFKATSGSVTAKERKLWVWTMGF